MEKKPNNRWQVRIAVIAIFLLGFAAGVLGVNAYRAWARAGALTPEDRLERLANRLQLKPDQKGKVQQIFSDTREQLQALRKESEPRVTDIRKQADERLRAVLTPEQWKQFQEVREEMRQRRGRERRGEAR